MLVHTCVRFVLNGTLCSVDRVPAVGVTIEWMHRCWQAGRTREQTILRLLLLAAGQQLLCQTHRHLFTFLSHRQNER